MSDTYRFEAGDSPLLISVPHDGRKLPEDIAAVMTPAGRTLPDTDWHVARLYEFARELGASLLVAEYSRYVVDLNRPPDDESLYPGQLKTGICPVETFAGEALYEDEAGIADEEREQRIRAFWQPYHDRLRNTLGELRQSLADLMARYGKPIYVLETAYPWTQGFPNDIGRAIGAVVRHHNDVEQAVADVARASPYSTVVNARFRGGYITRHYGDPGAGCNAIQLEMAQRCYMDEDTLAYDPSLAAKVTGTLREMLEVFTRASSK